MLEFYSNAVLQQYVIYIVSTVSNLQALKRILKLDNRLELGNLRTKTHRIISLRAPKHFNIGKHQFLLKKHFLRVTVKNVNWVYNSVNLQLATLNNIKPLLCLNPTQKITHTKLDILYTFRLLV